MQLRPYPVQYSVDYPDRKLDRGTTFFRILVAIPILIVVGTVDGATASYSTATGQVTTIAFGTGGALVLGPALMILFRAKYPRWWFDWNLELHLGESGLCRIDEERHDGRRGDQLVQQFQPLRFYLQVNISHAGDVAARPVKAGHEAEPDRVGARFKDDRDSRGRRLGRKHSGAQNFACAFSIARLRKIILVASQFFAFSHSLGPKRRSLRRNQVSGVGGIATSRERLVVPKILEFGRRQFGVAMIRWLSIPRPT